MHARGQAALDLMMAFILVLVIGSALSTVVQTYTSTQKEIGIHQQLHESGNLIALFLSNAMLPYHAPQSYPTALGLSSTLVTTVNSFTRGSGALSPFSIRAFEFPQGVPCSIITDWDQNTISLRVEGSDVGLSTAVQSVHPFYPPQGFELYHSLNVDGCSSPVSLESLP
jgi:hypothetical protein